MSDWKKLREIAETVATRNRSVKRGHPKYTANVSSAEEVALTDGVLALLDENDSLRAEVDRLQESTERGNALLELHQVAREKSELATAVDLLESENNTLTGEVMSLASRLDTLRAQLSAALAAKEEACDALEMAACKTPSHLTGAYLERAAQLRSIGKDGGNG